MRKQPLETQTIYAELVDRLVTFEASRTIGHLQGAFVTKTIKGEAYAYFQYSEPGGTKRQLYVGRRDASLDRVIERFTAARGDAEADREGIRRLCALLRAGGAQLTDAASARVLRALADAGVFSMGGVLVGTHAFAALGNVLGAVWEGAWLRTQDIDVAADPAIGVAVPELCADVPDVLERLGMGFLPVPALDRGAPSTSFKVRGQALRVDLLTPATGRPGVAAVPVSRLGTMAKPLPYLEFLTESPLRAALVAGDAVLVDVPDPARFAVHKLIVSGARPASDHAKRDKDLRQAAEVFDLLLDERPADVEVAWEALESRGRGWVKRAEAGLASLATTVPHTVERLRALTRAS